jgi:predicted DsbA family dithiol-disulfide isomerase
MQEIIVDCSTGQQTVRDLTPEEIAEREAQAAAFAAEQAEREAAEAAKAEQKAAVLAALATAAGLDVEEVKAVLA